MEIIINFSNGCQVLTSNWQTVEDYYTITKESLDSIFIDDKCVYDFKNRLDCLLEHEPTVHKVTSGVKESQSVTKAPVFTYCKVNNLAIEALALRALYGHNKYGAETVDKDWRNFTRVPNADFEYSNSMFRHALGLGEDSERDHLIATAWNAVSRLQIYLENEDTKN